jgi:hypothetical protein
MSESYKDALFTIHRLAMIETGFIAIINQAAAEDGIDPVPLMTKINEMAHIRTEYVRQLEMLVTALKLKKKRE